MKKWRKIVAIMMAVLSLVFLALALSMPRSPGDTDSAARRTERLLSSRLRLLDKYIERGLTRLPEDMVVYRYHGDSLVSWNNQFTVSNDGINSGQITERLVNPRGRMLAPLSQITEETGFYNFGSKWYLAWRVNNGEEKSIIALEIMNTMDGRTFNGVNPKLRLDGRYSIKPLSFSGGSSVSIGGKPQFKILYDSLTGRTTADSGFIWLSFVFFVLCAFLCLFNGRTLERASVISGCIVLVIAIMYLWGYSAQNDILFFSPMLYAGKVFFSLGAVVLVNLAIFLVSSCFYLVREDIQSRMAGVRRKRVAVAVALVAALSIAVYSVQTFSSIILNSSYSFEFSRFGGLSFYSFVVFFSFITMLLGIPMLLRTMKLPPDLFSSKGRLAYSLLIALFMVVTIAILGFRKEQDRLSVWANRLAVERDISLELRLRRLENQIASDLFIPALAQLDNASIIKNRIIEAYFPRVSQDYDISVYLIDDRSLPDEVAFCSERVRGGEPISPNSRFNYIYSGTGKSRYDGIFLYFSEQTGLLRMLLEVEPRWTRNQGYSNMFGLSAPGQVTIPSRYSYARYSGRDLQLFHGTYAYPTRLSDEVYSQIQAGGQVHLAEDLYRHFVNSISDDESIIISRAQISLSVYAIAVVSVALVIFLILSLFSVRLKRRDTVERAYFKSRISAVIMTSLVLALVVLATVSVVFVYRSNERNMHKVMSEKINAVQAMVHSRLGPVRSVSDLMRSDLPSLLKGVGEDTSSDINLYSYDGRLMFSTAPEVFERMLMGGRVDAIAYDNIIIKQKRYFINRERIRGNYYYCMYAPLVGEDGDILALIGSPYTEEGYSIERDAVIHSITILTVFIILLILARVMVAAVLDRVFKPLSEMGRKMSSANLDSLECIDYDRNDEIRTLVLSYNRMVNELSESTKRLAQAERDKAWSGMARQVAHEIKNPLTPMKLQLQRIIRLKQKDDPEWQDKFDEATKVLLDHIEVLSDTANEFSTFAKLYSEEHTSIDLDRMLQDEMSMYDNRDDVRFEYIGFSNAMVMGPKPQLTRVVVNLLNNAVQAAEGLEGGTVRVSLRNSVKDGFYDIVVEDNGPGVPAENAGKLFTPNFTTKNGGSGLGLAISRSILERCGAEIVYSKSFSLGGACFTISYPK